MTAQIVRKSLVNHAAVESQSRSNPVAYQSGHVKRYVVGVFHIHSVIDLSCWFRFVVLFSPAAITTARRCAMVTIVAAAPVMERGLVHVERKVSVCTFK